MNSISTINASEYCTKVFDGTHDTPMPTELGKPLITSKHIKNLYLDFSGTYNISNQDFELINKRSGVHQWDILFSMIGSIGEVYLEKNTEINYAIKNLGVFSTNDEMKAKWLYYYLQSPIARKHIQRYLSGAVQKFLPLGALREFPIINYDIDRIKYVQILSSLDAKIELNNKINKELEAIAKTLYDYWFVQFDFPDENRKPYKSSGGKMVYNEELKREIPEGWDVKELKEIIKVERGISYKSADINEGIGCPMINLNSFYLDGSYKPEGIKYFNSKYTNNKVVIPGDLIIATTDVTRNADIIGKATIIPNIYQDDILLSCDIAKLIYDDSLDKYFLEKLFNSHFYHEYIKGFASGTLVLHLNTDGIGWYKTFIPPKDLLDKFSKLMNPIQKKKELTILENQKLTKLRDWLLPMLMNGQVSVK